MKKGMLKGQRRKLFFTVIFIMILTVSLNMIAFIWFQLRGVSYDISAGICGYETETNFTVWGYGKRV